jgi:hypothetical protein
VGASIDKRHVCGQVRKNDRVEQPFIARLQVGEQQVFLQIARKVGDLDPLARDL